MFKLLLRKYCLGSSFRFYPVVWLSFSGCKKKKLDESKIYNGSLEIGRHQRWQGPKLFEEHIGSVFCNIIAYNLIKKILDYVTIVQFLTLDHLTTT